MCWGLESKSCGLSTNDTFLCNGFSILHSGAQTRLITSEDEKQMNSSKIPEGSAPPRSMLSSWPTSSALSSSFTCTAAEALWGVRKPGLAALLSFCNLEEACWPRLALLAPLCLPLLAWWGLRPIPGKGGLAVLGPYRSAWRSPKSWGLTCKLVGRATCTTKVRPQINW